MSVVKKIQGDLQVENLVNPNYDANDPNNSTKNPELHETLLRTSTFTIDGDVVVLGDTIVEDIEERSVLDPILVLNSSHDEDTDEELIHTIPPSHVPEDPTGPQVAVGGLEINRGTIDGTADTARRVSVQIRYNDTGADRSGTETDLGYWEASDDGMNYYPLHTADFMLINDPNPHLGGDLIVNDYAITGVENVPPGGGGDVIIQADGDLILSSDSNSTSVGEIKVNNPLNITVQIPDPGYVPGYHTVYAKAIGSGGTGLYVTNNQKSEELVSRSKAIVFGLIF